MTETLLRRCIPVDEFARKPIHPSVLLQSAPVGMGIKAAYATLLTKTSYLPGVLVLEYTLRSVGSEYSLVVMATPALSQESRDILARRRITVIDIQSLQPPAGTHALSAHDARFADTWTKLR